MAASLAEQRAAIAAGKAVLAQGGNIGEAITAGTSTLRSQGGGVQGPSYTPKKTEEELKQEFKETLEAQGFKTENLDYQWQQELREVAHATEGNVYWNSSISPTQAQKTAFYYEGLGQPEKAQEVLQYYTQKGPETLDNRVERAIGMGFLPSEYYSEGQYDFLSAVADKKVTDSDLARIGLDEATRQDLINAGQVWSALQSGGYCSGEGCNLAGALAAGAVTEGQVRASKLFLGSDVDSVVQMGLVPSGEAFRLEGGKVASITWDPLGAIWRWEGPINPQTGKIKPAGPWKDWTVNAGGEVKHFTSKAEAIEWAEDNGYEVSIGFGTSMKMAGATALGIAQTPEFTLATAGIGAAAPQALGAGLARFVPARLAGWLTGPSKVSTLVQGMKLGTAPVTAANIGRAGLLGGEAALRALTIPTIASTAAATWAGLSYKPQSSQLVGLSNYQAFKASSEYTKALREYVGAGGTEGEFNSQVKGWFVEQAGKGMEYQPGIIGMLGRGGAVANLPVQSIQSLGLPSLPKSLLTGVYQVYNPLAVTQQLYPQVGAKALTTLIPYFGPVTMAGAFTWGQQPWYGKLATVGFTALPFASGALSAFRVPRLSTREMQLRRLGIGPRYSLPSVEYTSYQRVLGGGRLVPEVTGRGYLLQGGGTFGGGTIGPARFITETTTPSIIKSLPGTLISKINLGKILTPQEELLAVRYVAGKIKSGEKLDALDTQIYTNNPRGVEFFLRELQQPVTSTRMVGGITARTLTPAELAMGKGTQFTLGRVELALGGKGGVAQPESMLYPIRQPLGYYGELQYPKEGPLPSGITGLPVGFFKGGSLLTEVPYKITRYSYPLEGSTPYFGGTTPQWMAKWAEFGGLPRNLWGPGGIWGKGGFLFGGGLGGGVGTSTQTGTQVGTMVEAPSVEGQPSGSLGSLYSPALGVGTKVATLPFILVNPLTGLPLVSEVVSPLTVKVLSPITTPLVVKSPFTTLTPSLYPIPLPSLVTTPVPTPVFTPTPVPPEPTPVIPRPPILWPGLGGSLGGGFGLPSLRGKRLGVGRWKFSGFKVSGPHPLELGTVGYTYMGGKEVPWGIGKEAPRTKKRSSKGLVRMVV